MAKSSKYMCKREDCYCAKPFKNGYCTGCHHTHHLTKNQDRKKLIFNDDVIGYQMGLWIARTMALKRLRPRSKCNKKDY